MARYSGDARDVTLKSGDDIAELSLVDFDVELEAGVALSAPALTQVGVDISLGRGATLDAPNLRFVGQRICLGVGATLNAPNLTILGESIHLGAGATLSTPRLTSVGEVRWNREMRTPPDESRHGVKHIAVDLDPDATFDAPLLTSICGHLEISPGSMLKTPLVTTIGGDCNVRAKCSLHLPLLARVLGELTVRSGATLDAPELEYTKRFRIDDDANLNIPRIGAVHDYEVRGAQDHYAPMLRSVDWLKVYEGATLHAPNLTSVNLILSLSKDATVHAPNLTHADCSVIIAPGARLEAPGLTTITTLAVEDDATLRAPALTSIQQQLRLYVGATLHAPALRSVGNLHLHRRSMLDAPLLTTIHGHCVASGDRAVQRLRDVAAAALATPEALEMRNWDTCATAHCIAGWAVALAGDVGARLSKEAGIPSAAAILLGVPAVSLFYLSNDEARERLQAILEPGEVPAV